MNRLFHSNEHFVKFLFFKFLSLFSVEVFQVSFLCSGKKAGVADMTIKLNYTTVQSGIVESEDQKMLLMVVRRECAATGIIILCIFSFLRAKTLINFVQEE